MKFETQQLIETRYAKNQQLPLLRREFTECEPLMNQISSYPLPEGFCVELLVQVCLHRRCPPETLLGLLKRFFETAEECAKALEWVAVETDLVDYDVATSMFIVKYDVSPDVRQLMTQYMYLPPMIVPPLPVTSNRGSGYLTNTSDSLILKQNHHDGDLALDSINRFNNVRFSLNQDVIRGIRNKRKNLDSPKDDESFQDYRKRVDAFEKFERDCMHTFALLVNEGNEFYLTHKYDKRGRTYCQGYHVSYQGNDYAKAVLELADAEVVL